MSNNRIKTNYDLLEEQQKNFTNGGELLRNILSISLRHPFLSLIFVLCFGILTNALFELCAVLVGQSSFAITPLAMVIVALIVIQAAIFFVIKWMHRDLFVATPINQKKVLITLVSPRKNFQKTPSYEVYEAMLYNTSGHAAINSLEKVILITSESQNVKDTATALKGHIEASGREVLIKSISINDRSLTDIQKQVELILSGVERDHKPHEIVSDYTGANKDMTIALLKASEKALILPVYLNDAVGTNHSRYN